MKALVFLCSASLNGFYMPYIFSRKFTSSGKPCVPLVRTMCAKDGGSLSQPWYSSGLKFECTQCGDCCSGSAGSVRFSEIEGNAIATRLNMPFPQFLETYCRKNGQNQWELKEVKVHLFSTYYIVSLATTEYLGVTVSKTRT